MTTTYEPHGVTLSDGQRAALAKAYSQGQPITIQLKHDELTGHDVLMLTKTQIQRIANAFSAGRGVRIKISKTQIKKVVQKGGSLFTSLAALAPKILPTLTNLATKVAPGLVMGATTSLGNFGMDKILGQGLQNRPPQSGGFLIPQDKVDKLIAYKKYLTKKQKEQIVNALQTGGQIVIKPTAKQSGGLLGTVLASIDVPLLLNALSGKGLQNRSPTRWCGCGLQNRPYEYAPLVFPPTPYLGEGLQNRPPQKKGSGLLLGKNSPFNGVPILGALL